MNNLFFCFGFIYILNSIHNLYDWTYNDKLTATIDAETSVSELITIRQELNKNKSRHILKEIISYLCLGWILLGIFLKLPENRFFIATLSVSLLYCFFIVFIGIIIGYKNTYKKNYTVYNDIIPNKRTIPIGKMKEVTKIVLVVIILILHYLF